MNIKATGVVIANRNFNESDKIYQVFTRELGMVDCIARSARKILARLAGNLQNGNLVQLELHKGKTFYTICSATGSSNHFFKINLKASSALQSILEIVKILIPSHSKNPEVLEDLELFIQNCNDDNFNVWKIYFLVRITSHLGFMPQLNTCAKCQNKLLPQKNKFLLAEGEIICNNCDRHQTSAIAISADAIKVARIIFSGQVSEQSLEKVPADIVCELDEIFTQYLEHIAQKKFSGRALSNKIKKLL